MLSSIKSSRRELLKAMEGKAPRNLVKRLTLIKDLNKLKALAKDVRQLEKLTEPTRARHLVEKYQKEDNNKLAALIQQSPELLNHLHSSDTQRRILTIRYSSFDKRAYFAAVRLAKACDLMGLTFSGPVGLPQKTRRWTVLKSPFKYKKHQESWEQRMIRSIVTIDTQDRGHLVPNLMKFLDKTNYVGVDVKIKTRRFIAPEQIYVDPYIKEHIAIKPAIDSVDYSQTAIDATFIQEAASAPLPNKKKVKKISEPVIKL